MKDTCIEIGYKRNDWPTADIDSDAEVVEKAVELAKVFPGLTVSYVRNSRYLVQVTIYAS